MIMMDVVYDKPDTTIAGAYRNSIKTAAGDASAQSCTLIFENLKQWLSSSLFFTQLVIKSI